MHGIAAVVGKTGCMQNPESTHQMAAWAHRPMLFAGCTAVVGTGAFGVAMLLPVGIPAVALAATGAVAAASGLLTLLILIVARATGLRQRTEAAQGYVAAESRAAQESAAEPPAAQESATVLSARPQFVDEPTQPIVIDLTDDEWVPSATR